MPGFDAEKKKNDLALKLKNNHAGIVQKYTAPNDQYSQLNNRIKKG